MKKALLMGALFIASTLAQTASAENEQTRNATAAEIRQHLGIDSKSTAMRNGYIYKQGGKTGYKFSNGRICILFPNNSTDCVDVKTNGKDFHAIDRKGGRTPL